MANSSLQLTSLDFDTLKQNFKTYLSSQSVFKDYNFDGSNINVLLDVMSYNTYLNSFYLNMVSSEMFLDSAQKYDSVVSHAKELNYLPQSSKSAISVINFDVETNGLNGKFTIPRGTRFSGSNSNGLYTFTTSETTVYVSANNSYSIPSLTIYEGDYFSDTYVINTNDESQRFILSNQNIDISSLTVIVTENDANTIYTRKENLFNLFSNSTIYFVQPTYNGQYEIVFGDGVSGKKLINSSIVNAVYRISSGSDADGINNFAMDDDLGPINIGSVQIGDITVSTPSYNGANQESIDSIKFNAPRYFATQQRAVSIEDYASIISSNFGGEVDDVNVYGGETIEPKRYGRVIVAVKPTGSTIASDLLKQNIATLLKNYIAIPNRVEITDPEYLYCSINCTVQYDKNATSRLSGEIEGVIRNTISNFATNYLQKFGSDFRYSRFVSAIDNSDISITSNDTNIKIIKKISPKLYYATSYVIDFNNSSDIEPMYYGKGKIDEPVLTSSAFTYVDVEGTEYPLTYINDDTQGNLVAFTYVNNVYTILNSTIGTIEYTTGKVNINNLITSNYGDYISIFMEPMNKDIIINKDKILMIEQSDITINLIQTLR